MDDPGDLALGKEGMGPHEDDRRAIGIPATGKTYETRFRKNNHSFRDLSFEKEKF
jgi:hypothetical protein